MNLLEGATHRRRLAVLFAIALAACEWGPELPTVHNATTVSSDRCDDPLAFEGSFMAADTTSLSGCAYFQARPSWRLVFTEGAPQGDGLTLTIVRVGRPAEGVHLIGAGSGIANIPRVLVTLLNKARSASYSSVTGFMTITKSLPDVLEGSLHLTASESRAGSVSNIALDIRFVAHCTTVLEAPCF